MLIIALALISTLVLLMGACAAKKKGPPQKQSSAAAVPSSGSCSEEPKKKELEEKIKESKSSEGDGPRVSASPAHGLSTADAPSAHSLTEYTSEAPTPLLAPTQPLSLHEEVIQKALPPAFVQTKKEEHMAQVKEVEKAREQQGEEVADHLDRRRHFSNVSTVSTTHFA